jgi:hypothetical protein
VIVVCAAVAGAQEKKNEKQDRPAITLTMPLAVSSGATSKLTVRGLKLDTATEVRCGNEKVGIKFHSAGKADVPGMMEAAKVGDTQVQFDLVLPDDFPPGELTLTILTSMGPIEHRLTVVAKDGIFQAKEPHNGFRDAQDITPGKLVLGAIEKAKDVDVFRIDLIAGQIVVVEIHADREGSPLDSILTLYDERRHVLATNDDRQRDNRDSRLEFEAPSSGIYYLSLIEAHDAGSALHVYRMMVRVE